MCPRSASMYTRQGLSNACNFRGTAVCKYDSSQFHVTCGMRDDDYCCSFCPTLASAHCTDHRHTVYGERPCKGSVGTYSIRVGPLPRTTAFTMGTHRRPVPHGLDFAHVLNVATETSPGTWTIAVSENMVNSKEVQHESVSSFLSLYEAALVVIEKCRVTAANSKALQETSDIYTDGKGGKSRRWHDVENPAQLLRKVLVTAATKLSGASTLPTLPGSSAQRLVPEATERGIIGTQTTGGKELLEYGEGGNHCDLSRDRSYVLTRPISNAFRGAQRIPLRSAQSAVYACEHRPFLCNRFAAISVMFLVQAKVNFIADALRPVDNRMKEKAGAGIGDSCHLLIYSSSWRRFGRSLPLPRSVVFSPRHDLHRVVSQLFAAPTSLYYLGLFSTAEHRCVFPSSFLQCIFFVDERGSGPPSTL